MRYVILSHHSAVDVEPDAPRGDDGLRVRGVEGGDVADGEAIARMDIGKA
jgi:hypothetical protein